MPYIKNEISRFIKPNWANLIGRTVGPRGLICPQFLSLSVYNNAKPNRQWLQKVLIKNLSSYVNTHMLNTTPKNKSRSKYIKEFSKSNPDEIIFEGRSSPLSQKQKTQEILKENGKPEMQDPHQTLVIEKHTQDKIGHKEKLKHKPTANPVPITFGKKSNVLAQSKHNIKLKTLAPTSLIPQALQKVCMYHKKALNLLQSPLSVVRIPSRSVVATGKKKQRQRPILGESTVVGFKKQLFNQVIGQGHMLYPAFNRRKHNHTYAMVVHNHRVRLSKVFYYLNKNVMASYTGLALKAAHKGTASSSRDKTLVRRAIPFLLSVIESDTALLLYRCQDQFFLRKSRQSINHGLWQPRAQRFLAHRHVSLQKSQETLTLNTPKKHNRWLNIGGVLRIL